MYKNHQDTSKEVIAEAFKFLKKKPKYQGSNQCKEGLADDFMAVAKKVNPNAKVRDTEEEQEKKSAELFAKRKAALKTKNYDTKSDDWDQDKATSLDYNRKHNHRSSPYSDG